LLTCTSRESGSAMGIMGHEIPTRPKPRLAQPWALNLPALTKWTHDLDFPTDWRGHDYKDTSKSSEKNPGWYDGRIRVSRGPL
jgi:hypothetical protein